MWQLLNAYFNFTKKERKGIAVVLIIIFILIALPLLFERFNKEERINSVQFEKEIAELRIDSSYKKFSKSSDEYYNDYTPSYKKYDASNKSSVFYFDPNSASIKDWMRLGIREKTANTIQKYISKGGKFYKPEDIKKIWGLSESDAARLIPYVSIKKIEKESLRFDQNKYPEKEPYSNKYSVQNIDINVADTAAYIALPGIGSKLSKRIIAFREKLGGFYSIDQVGETYLLPDSTFQKIKKYLVLNSKAIKKLNINSATVDEMKSHPYIRYYLANAIFQYRQQHGNYNSIEEIKKIMPVTDDIYNKASPYLTIE
ncbi:MAG: helix-hairpin-helix domain-containing protein [Ginsengibacter sp.]